MSLYKQDVEAAYQLLQNKKDELFEIFFKPLQTQSPTLEPSSQEIYFVRSFCLLFHASIEDYFEKITSLLAKYAVEAYENISFLAQTDLDTLSLPEINEKLRQQLHTYLMLANKHKSDSLEEIEKNAKFFEAKKSTISNKIMDLKPMIHYATELLTTANKNINTNIDKNHGISFNNNIPLFLSVGIDIGTVANTNNLIPLRESIHKLAHHRGNFAHHNQDTMLTNILSLTDTLTLIKDCMDFCSILKDAVFARF